MFDISWGEFLVIGVVALVVIGPKELPGVIRAVGRAMGKVRTMAGEFRGQWDDAMRDAEMQNVAKDLNEFKDQATGLSTSTFDPIRREVQNAVEGTKADVADASGITASQEALNTISSDAAALEAEIRAGASDNISAAPVLPAEPASEPEPAPPSPKRRSKKEAQA